MYRWKKCTDSDFLHCENIFPVQQRKVAEIIEKVRDNPNVMTVTVFGSSVTPRCHTGSDLDLYFELKKPEYPLAHTVSFATDMWNNFTVDDSLREEIEKTGVLVYEREA